ncbi:MAG: hypothetical protein FJY37_19575 [Betaproteobacteria bacterium]|nr:hypothetical protein [Betaproteobacteria bacterium]
MNALARRAFLAIVLAVALHPHPAHARRRVRIGGSGLTGRKTYAGPNVLRPEQLRGCLQSEREINRLGEALDFEEENIQAASTRLNEMQRGLDERQRRVDVYNKQSVDAFNREVDRHRRAVSEYNSKLPDFNSRVQAFNARIGEFNSSCAGKSYYEDDMKVARAALGLD